MLKISKDLNVSRCAIRNIIRKHEKGFGLQNKSKLCTPPKLSKREKRKLIVMSKKNRFLTANELRSESGLVKVSVSTIKRCLRDAKLFGPVAVKKPRRNQKLMKKRMLWCSKRKDYNDTDWNKYIFTDESKIELYPRRRQYVRRNVNECLKPFFYCKNYKIFTSYHGLG